MSSADDRRLQWADHEKWLARSLWTDEQAASLLCGIDPAAGPASVPDGEWLNRNIVLAHLRVDAEQESIKPLKVEAPKGLEVPAPMPGEEIDGPPSPVTGAQPCTVARIQPLGPQPRRWFRPFDVLRWAEAHPSVPRLPDELARWLEDASLAVDKAGQSEAAPGAPGVKREGGNGAEAGDEPALVPQPAVPDAGRRQFSQNEQAVLDALLVSTEPLTHGGEGGLERATSLEKSSVGRALKNLQQLKLVAKATGTRGFVLTPEGRAAAEQLENGET